MPNQEALRAIIECDEGKENHHLEIEIKSGKCQTWKP